MFLKTALVNCEEKTYLLLIFLISPFLNFLAGISYDLYAPSMPALAEHFNASIVTIKNSITITILGFAVGSLILGVFIDFFGRRTILIPTLFLYIVISLAAPFVTTVTALLTIRFFQGVFTAAAGIGSRALVVDYFTGKQFMLAVLYASIAYGLGMVMAPFFGGYLQYHYGWEACFYTFAAVAALIEILIILFVHESLTRRPDLSLWQMSKVYIPIMKNSVFMAGTVILSIILIQQLIYATLGVFMVQTIMGFSPIVYGNTALALGLSYLMGTFLNRSLIDKLSVRQLIYVGFAIVFGSIFAQFLLAQTVGLNIVTLILPLIGVNIGLGFFFGNIVGICLKLFPKYAGMNTAIQSCLFMLLGAIGIFIINYIHVTDLQTLAYIYIVLAMIQLIAFTGFIHRTIE